MRKRKKDKRNKKLRTYRVVFDELLSSLTPKESQELKKWKESQINKSPLN